MKRFSINRIYLAFAVVIICLVSCVFSEDTYLNVIVISVAFGVYFILMAFAFDDPTEGEEKVIDKLKQIF